MNNYEPVDKRETYTGKTGNQTIQKQKYHSHR